MKLIFLDCDGVISFGGQAGLCATRLDMLAELVHNTGAEVVLTSMWRLPHCREDLRKLNQEMEMRDVMITYHTPILHGRSRGEEIDTFLHSIERRRPVGYFAIIDDDPNDEIKLYRSGNLLYKWLVKCDSHEGLTESKLKEAASYLGGYAPVEQQTQELLRQAMSRLEFICPDDTTFNSTQGAPPVRSLINRWKRLEARL